MSKVDKVLNIGVLGLLSYLVFQARDIFGGFGSIEDNKKNDDIEVTIEAEAIRDQVVNPYYRDIVLNAETLGIPPETIAAVIQKESGGNPLAVSTAFAFGLMQVKQAALTDVNDSFNTSFVLSQLKIPSIAIFVGSRYLKLAYTKFGAWSEFEALTIYKEGVKGKDVFVARGQDYATDVQRMAKLIKGFF